MIRSKRVNPTLPTTGVGLDSLTRFKYGSGSGWSAADPTRIGPTRLVCHHYYQSDLSLVSLNLHSEIEKVLHSINYLVILV